MLFLDYMEKIIKRGLIFFIILQALDVLSTYLGDMFSKGEEMNPLAAMAINHGYVCLIVFKVVIILVVCFGINKICQLKKEKFATALIFWASGIYTLAVLSNLFLLLFY